MNQKNYVKKRYNQKQQVNGEEKNHHQVKNIVEFMVHLENQKWIQKI